MTRSLFSRLATLALAPVFAAGLGVSAAQADFRGGGVAFALTDECAPAWPGSVLPLRIRYSASEDNPGAAPPSEITLAFGTGTEHFALWGPMTPSGNAFLGVAGRQTWSQFVFYDNRPLMRIVQRSVTQRINPAGGDTIANAQEILLRLRIQNVSNIRNCAATITATLRRS